MKTKIFSFVLVLVLNSCIQTISDEELTMIKTPYSGKGIRIDGCYVSNPDELKKHCEYDFFYSNGVCFSLSDKLNITSSFNFTGGIDSRRNDKSGWGLFQISNNIINVQTWKLSDVAIQFLVQKRLYKIINDTTLSCDILNDGDIRTYHFKRFSPKPDSTNIFIK